jgi:predicted DNA-binding protein with PD1-like motif
MKINSLRAVELLSAGLLGACLVLLSGKSIAQEYVPTTQSPKAGLAPGMKVKLVGQNNGVKTYVLVFAKGDEIMSGLTDFATQYHVTAAHFTAIGSAQSARLGWLDRQKNLFRLIPITEQSEITSLIGDIAMYHGKPVVHAHINLAAQDGTLKGGHLFEAIVWPTLEVFVTVEAFPLNKRLDEIGITVIDPDIR